MIHANYNELRFFCWNFIITPLFTRRISRLEGECHALRQQVEELNMYRSMLERREAERVEVRSQGSGVRSSQ